MYSLKNITKRSFLRKLRQSIATNQEATTQGSQLPAIFTTREGQGEVWCDADRFYVSGCSTADHALLFAHFFFIPANFTELQVVLTYVLCFLCEEDSLGKVQFKTTFQSVWILLCFYFKLSPVGIFPQTKCSSLDCGVVCSCELS